MKKTLAAEPAAVNLAEMRSRALQYARTHEAETGCADGAHCPDKLTALAIARACDTLAEHAAWIDENLLPMVTRR